MILCVDPDSAALESTRETLADAGYETVGHGTLESAQRAVSEAHPDCLVTAYDLPDGDGLELISTVRELSPDTACILYTDHSIDEIGTAAFGETVVEFLRRDRPDSGAELVALVEHSLAFRNHTSYPLPDDENARLSALEQYTAEPAGLSDALDRLTDIATALFDIDSAAVGLIDAHSEEFISCAGASYGRMEREETICTYAILDDRVTVIEDVAADPRFETNEGLAAAGIRFYAGAPIVTPDGHAIGVFCVHDAEPRTFSERDRTLLVSLAAQAMDQMELRRQLQDAEVTDDDE